MGHHHHGHHHGAHAELPTARLTGAAVLNTGFAVVQVTVGLALGSVAVLADAAHQVVDAIGLVTALAAAWLTARPHSSTMSFGWGKSDALGALVSGLLLMASVAWIASESIGRLRNPVDVDGGGVIAIGLVAIAVNGASVVALSGLGASSLSVRAARLHLLTDLAGSVVVVLAGLLLVGTDARWVDPAASLLLCILVLRATIGLLRTAGRELLDRAPDGLSVDKVSELLNRQPGVERVHHVHVRSLGRSRTSVTAHVVVGGRPSLHDAQQQIGALNAALADDLGVDHTTLQLECHPCGDDDC